MKKLLRIWMTIIATAISLSAQTDPYNHTTAEPMIVYGYDLMKEVSDTTNTKIANANLIFMQIGDVRTDSNLGEVYVIQFWPIKNEDAAITKDSTRINMKSTNKNEFYCIKSVDYKEPTIKKRYRTWNHNAKPNIGTLVVPIKFRPGQGDVPFDFTTDFTLGSSFGFSFRMSHYQPNYVSVVGVFGITSVGVDSVSTEGAIADPNTKLSAVTPGLGMIAEISGFQIGGVVGWDIVGGTTGQKWIYNKKAWFSFGIGYQFLRKDNDE